MKRMASFSVSILTVFILLVGWIPWVRAALLDELVAAAKREGALNLVPLNTFPPEAVAALGVAFNKKYGVDIKLKYFPSQGLTRDTATVISRSAMGLSPEWDLMILTEAFHARLAARGLLLPFDYTLLSVDPKAIHHNNGSVNFAHSLMVILYNTKLVAAKDVPRRWEDLLDPKWKDGKLGVPDSVHQLALLATGSWGVQKTTEFVRGLARQRPSLGRQPELYTRLQLGEILVAAGLPDEHIFIAKKTGAPIASAAAEPIPVSTYNIGVLKGASHPNAAHLLVSFMVSPDGHDIWFKYTGNSSAFAPGSPIYKALQGREAIFWGGQDPEFIERLSNDYRKILGFVK